MTNVFLPSLVASSPYNIAVFSVVCGDRLRASSETCDDGNLLNGDGCSSECTIEAGWSCTGGTSSSQDLCEEICGDGIRFNSNSILCDDGNTINGDGCSNQCRVENEWSCEGGSKEKKDGCKEICGDGIRINTNSTFCDDANFINGDGLNSTCFVESGWTCSRKSSTSKDICTKIISDDEQQKLIGAAAVGAILGAVAVFSLCNISSPQGLWISMNQFQMILLLFLTKSNIPKTIVNYLAGLKASTCSFNFIQFKDIPGLSKVTSYLDFPLANSDLNYFGVSSGSAFVNNFSLICILIIIGISNIFFAIVYKLCKRKTGLNKVTKCLDKTKNYYILVFI